MGKSYEYVTLPSRDASAIVLAAAAGLLLPRSAHAGIEFPPLDATAFIQLYDIESGLHSCPAAVCTLVSGATIPVTLPSTTFSPNPPDFISASGDVSATAIHATVSGNNAVEYDLAMKDTYTVKGVAAGLFPVTVHFSASGSLETIPLSPTLDFLFAGSSTITIGSFDVDPASTPLPEVFPFDASTRASTGAVTLISSTGPESQTVSQNVSYTKMVSVGDEFDIGYELSLGFAEGAADFAHTAAISFDLPDGVFLTSAQGATFGAPKTPAVPEPETLPLFAAGLIAMGAIRPWRRKRAAAL